MSKTLFMETTKIDAGKTVAEIQCVLSKSGASQVLTEYQNGEVEAVSFKVKIGGSDIPFRLPCRWREVETLLDKKKKPEKYFYAGEWKHRNNVEQAKRVAWRQILRWVEAQMAMVETNMVKIEEVFMPYMQNHLGKTLFEIANENQFKMLGHEEAKP